MRRPIYSIARIREGLIMAVRFPLALAGALLFYYNLRRAVQRHVESPDHYLLCGYFQCTDALERLMREVSAAGIDGADAEQLRRFAARTYPELDTFDAATALQSRTRR